jgi:hypothetical protein
MARKTIGTWLRQALGGQGTGKRHGATGPSPYVGKQVSTNDGNVLGTIIAVRQGTEATDGASHEDTLVVRGPVQNLADLLYIPTAAIARVSDQGVILTVDATQVTARGWRYRPAWLPQDNSLGTPTATAP